MKRWFWFGILVLGACQWFPWGRRDAKPVAEHLAENFYGVYVPWGDFLVGCRWDYYETPYGMMAGCRGIWKLDRGTGEMVPLRDTGRKIGAIEVSRNFQFLVYIRGNAWGWNPDSEPDSLVGLVLLDLHTGDTTVLSLEVGILGRLYISPLTPEIFYGRSLENWGREMVIWRIDFRNGTFTPVKRCPEGRFGALILPGAKGDSVVCSPYTGIINYVLDIEAGWGRHGVYLFKENKEYRVAGFPIEDRDVPYTLHWVHDQDTLIVATFGGNGPDWTPARWDLWWIPEIQDHLEEVPDTTGGGP